MVGNIPRIRQGCVAVFGSTDRKSATERVVILAEARATDPAVLDKLQSEVTIIATDLLGTPPFFAYAQGSTNATGDFLLSFNSNDNIRGTYVDPTGNSIPYTYEALKYEVQNDPANADTYFLRFDNALKNSYTGFKSERGLQGSPLAPRIPSMVRVQLWVARRGASTGDAPIRHWFSEVVSVPTGMTRRAPTTIASSSGNLVSTLFN